MRQATLDDVTRTVEALGAQGMRALVAPLPHPLRTAQAVSAEKRRFFAVLAVLREQGLSADLSLKPSQLGAARLWTDCVEAVEEIAALCRFHGSFLWLDMEQPSSVDLTLALFEEVSSRWPNVGVCLQACLKRTARDLDRVLRREAPVRLVKGFFRARAPETFASWREVTDNYINLVPELLARSRRPAIGTHDPLVIHAAKRALALAPARKLAGTADEEPLQPLEFQFFHGVKDKLQKRLVQEGWPVRVYLPYGPLLPWLGHTLPMIDWKRAAQRLMGRSEIR